MAIQPLTFTPSNNPSSNGGVKTIGSTGIKPLTFSPAQSTQTTNVSEPLNSLYKTNTISQIGSSIQNAVKGISLNLVKPTKTVTPPQAPKVTTPTLTPDQQKSIGKLQVGQIIPDFNTPQAGASATLKQTPQTLQQTAKSVKSTTAVVNAFQSIYPQLNQTMKDLRIDPLSFQANPKKALQDGYDTIKAAITKDAPKIGDYFKQYGASLPNNPKQVGQAGTAAAAAGNIVFSPISALFAAANDIPVLGTAAKLITLPFTVLGESGTGISNTIIDRLPISQAAKDQIKPGLGEIAALAAQLIGGAGLGGEKARLTEKFGAK